LPPAPATAAVHVVGYVVKEADLALGREYVGLVEPIQTVMLMPQVAGQIASVNFKEGAMVRQGDLLFTIDSAQYEATVAARKADVARAEAALARSVKYYNRLKAADSKSVSASDLELAESDVQQGRATVAQANAALKLAQIDLGHAKITAPISGKIGRALVTKGNYVAPASATLATIVQINPIRVSFALPDKAYIERVAAFHNPGEQIFNVSLTLPDGTKYAPRGKRDFEANTMQTSTGTMTLYMRFDNGKGDLVPGSMARVMVRPVKSHIAPVLPQEAVMTDGKGDYVYVIGPNNVAERRDVKLCAEIGTSREVLSGLKPGDKVVTSGLFNVRLGSPVSPTYASDDDKSKTPGELAKQSGYDLAPISLDQKGSSK
jgi:RND family efflux transporter MFP subunit